MTTISGAPGATPTAPLTDEPALFARTVYDQSETTAWHADDLDDTWDDVDPDEPLVRRGQRYIRTTSLPVRRLSSAGLPMSTAMPPRAPLPPVAHLPLPTPQTDDGPRSFADVVSDLAVVSGVSLAVGATMYWIVTLVG